MDPSGYCHRKPNGVWILLLPRTLSPSVRQYNCLPTSWNGFRLQLKALTHRVSAPSKPHRLDSLARPTKTPHVILDIPGRQLWRPCGRLRFRFSQILSSRMDCLCFVSSASFPWLPSTPLSTLHSQLFQDQALDRLVSPSCMCYHTSTDDLSTLSSSRGLTLF